LVPPWVGDRPVDLEGQLDQPGVALDGQISDRDIAAPVLLDFATFERDGRVVLDVEKIRGFEVVVPVLVGGVDRRRFDRHLDR
jgi:hypothetical protein